MVTMYIPIHEAFDDTPLFRDRLHEEERRVHNTLESIQRITKIHKEIVRLTEAASLQRQLLIKELDQPLFDEKISGPLKMFQKALKDIEERRAVHSVQVETVLIEPLVDFQEELESVAMMGKKFEAADAAVKSCMDKYLVRKAKKEQEDAAAEEVATSRMQLHKVAIDLGGKLNEVKRKRACQVSEHVVGLIYTEMAFHHQCFELLSGLQPIMDALTVQLHEMKGDFATAQKADLASVAPIENYLPGSPRQNAPTAGAIRSGYLFARLPGRRNIWRRQWYELAGSNLTFIVEGNKVSVPLNICLVKEQRNETRSNVFEIINPSETLTLQALSETDLRQWILALQNAIAKAIHSGEEAISDMDDSRPGMNGNEGVPEEDLPDIVRSLTLDRWSLESSEMMLSLGNRNVNSLLEANLNGTKKPTPDSERQEKEAFLQAKYNRRQFMKLLKPDDSNADSVPQQFMSSIKNGDLVKTLWSLLLGMDVNDKDMYDKAALHYAVERQEGRIVEFLLVWGADINVLDDVKRSPLHHAAALGNPSLVTLLIKKGAKIDLVDGEGKTPEEITMEHINDGDGYVRIVTILRLTRFRSSADGAWQTSSEFDDALNEIGSAPSVSNSNLTRRPSEPPTSTPSSAVTPQIESKEEICFIKSSEKSLLEARIFHGLPVKREFPSKLFIGICKAGHHNRKNVKGTGELVDLSAVCDYVKKRVDLGPKRFLVLGFGSGNSVITAALKERDDMAGCVMIDQTTWGNQVKEVPKSFPLLFLQGVSDSNRSATLKSLEDRGKKISTQTSIECIDRKDKNWKGEESAIVETLNRWLKRTRILPENSKISALSSSTSDLSHSASQDVKNFKSTPDLLLRASPIATPSSTLKAPTPAVIESKSSSATTLRWGSGSASNLIPNDLKKGLQKIFNKPNANAEA
ncbi:Arf-GAP with coiled-coil, ANK repeat and PH domain-containing protein 2 [Phlyctochytrium planicorne]|nr:Arf-GAP with coiled-coil, ANK repeat and PH domain-containing protein 2 [Phlyctochytrium planicorne]